MAGNFRKRRDKAWKKQAKKNKTSLLSSSGRECKHYSHRCAMRGETLFKPVRRKAIKKKILNKTLTVKKLTRGRVLIIDKQSGEKKVLSKNLKAGITFMLKI